MSARAFVMEDQTQSCGKTITSHLDQFKAVSAIAAHRPAPPALARQMVAQLLSGYGVETSMGQANEIVNFVVAAVEFAKERE